MLIQLLQERLIACANIVSPVSSLFWWKEKVEEELSERVRALHSYEVPEVLAPPIIKGLSSYLEWLGASLKPVRNRG